jgi:hypothetical protein
MINLSKEGNPMTSQAPQKEKQKHQHPQSKQLVKTTQYISKVAVQLHSHNSQHTHERLSDWQDAT